MIYCASPFNEPFINPTPRMSVGLLYGGVIVVTWFRDELAQMTKSHMSYSLTITQDRTANALCVLKFYFKNDNC
jgi:hypothetical protein